MKAHIHKCDLCVGKSITCLICNRISHNPNDVKHRYCGCCHIFHNTTQIPPYRTLYFTGDIVEVTEPIRYYRPPITNTSTGSYLQLGVGYKLKVWIDLYNAENLFLCDRYNANFTIRHNQVVLYHRPLRNWIKYLWYKITGK
jgi:hypothetical protein